MKGTRYPGCMFEAVLALLLTWMAPVDCPAEFNRSDGVTCLKGETLPLADFQARLPSDLMWEPLSINETGFVIGTTAPFPDGGGVAYFHLGGLVVLAPRATEQQP